MAVLDDESKFRQALSRLLKTHGFRVHGFADGRELLTALTGQEFDCLLIDLHMPGVPGFDVLAELAGRAVRPPVIVITGQDEPGNAGRAAALGAVDYLLKPLDETSLLAALQRALGGEAPDRVGPVGAVSAPDAVNPGVGSETPGATV